MANSIFVRQAQQQPSSQPPIQATTPTPGSALTSTSSNSAPASSESTEPEAKPKASIAQGTNNPSTPSSQASNSINTQSTPAQPSTKGTSAQLSSSSHSSSSVAPGAVAGIAIGCILAGIILGLVAAFFFLRRRNRKKTPLKPLISKPSPAPASANIGNVQLDHFLLEATPDETIALEMEALRTLIRQHVDSHYHRRPMDEDASSLSQPLAKLGFNHQVAALCLDHKTRQQALQHVLSHVIFTSVDFHSRAELSLLPASVSAFIEEIPSNKNELIGDSRMKSQAFSQWRRLSVYLLHPDRGLRTPLPSDNPRVTSQAQELTAELNTVLRFFSEPDTASQQEQTRHLELVILECAKLGYVLLSQPSDWRFVTENPGTKEADYSIVVEAGLMKLSDRDGVPYRSPRSVVDPVVYVGS
ncbi:hypothetical protein CP533_4012 [Ophiocordyceps camponoti-saundersi (nom. inval.)]|nr:hypothetical protein CP533_4012 [Ophiocordyceps camponoti-saundersi (nom. inval.)]